MRILIVAGLFPPDGGAPAAYVPWAASALAHRGHSVKVLTLANPAASADSGVWPFPVERIDRSLVTGKRRGEIQKKIATAAAAADLLYINGLAVDTAVANAKLKKPMVVKVVGDVVFEQARRAGLIADTTDEFEGLKLTPQNLASQFFRGWAAKQASRVIAPNGFLRSVAAGWGVKPEKVDVVYHAANIAPNTLQECAKRREKRRESDTVGAIRFLSVGKLVAWKNIEPVLQAMMAIPNGHLTVVGEGPDKERLQSIASQLPCSNRIQFTGALQTKEIHGRLAESDALVINSSYEPFPQTAVESIALGTPVLAASSGAIDETVTHGFNGLIFPSDRPDALLDALKEFQKNERLRRILLRGCSQSYDLTNSDWMIAETERILTAAASQRA
jgi:glycosyltransferase involved in cell wall biosynthesis